MKNFIGEPGNITDQIIEIDYCLCSDSTFFSHFHFLSLRNHMGENNLQLEEFPVNESE